MSGLDLSEWIRPGDGIVVGQCCAEPTPLVEALVAQAPGIGGLDVFVGMTFGDHFGTSVEGLRVTSYGALGRTARIRDLNVVPCHFSALPRLFAERRLPGDVALIQVAPPDEHGRCSLGVGVDYLEDALTHARVVIAEVNERCPRTTGAWIDQDRVDVAVETSRELVEAPAPAPGDRERAIAANVAALVEDGDTLQLGVGALPEAILGALTEHRDLSFHSGMLSDAVLDLIEAGAITNAGKTIDAGLTVAGAALGTRRLFDALDARDDVLFRPVSHTHAAVVLSQVGPLCAINSALEIDLRGQVNAESVGGRRIGAVGGQVDFLRAAVANGGRGIIALPASRIVESLDGPVTTARPDVDWVVTEHGATSLRGLTDEQCTAALTELAGEPVAT